MIVADKKKIIFIHIQKTGGSSITNLLMPYISEEYRSANPRTHLDSGVAWQRTWHIDRRQHSKFIHALPVLDNYNVDPNDYFKIAFVRNPYSWLLSVWADKYRVPSTYQKTWLKKIKGKISDITGIKRLPVQKFYAKYPDGSFKNFVKFIDSVFCNDPSQKQSAYVGYADQYSYLENERGINFDYVGKMENFAIDIHAINDKVNMTDNLEIPRLNYKSIIKKRDKFLEHYDRDTIQIVNRLFARDFEIFGYETIDK